MDETCIKISGKWKYLYRAVGCVGPHGRLPAAFAPRSRRSTLLFRTRDRKSNVLPEKATIDKSGANPAAIAGMRSHSLANIKVRQSKYLTNLIEEDHRAIKRVVRPMLGFKSIQGAHAIIAGIKTMQLIKKRQLDFVRDRTSYAADTFYFLTS